MGLEFILLCKIPFVDTLASMTKYASTGTYTATSKQTD